MKLPRQIVVLLSSSILTVASCGGGGGSTGTGGASASGGASGSGGASASGGSTGTGGASASGGATGTGGVSASGGSAGGTATGGRGGTTGTGGRGGTTGTGGRGGTTGGGGSTGAGGTSAMMSFFVTSRGPGDGGNLGGLAGADTFCKMLAMAVSADLGAKTWRAYLSTSTENARDRIGTGPWRNAAGVVIANNLADLHDQTAANAALNATWPIASTAIALDERGAVVPTSPNVHDIITGSNTDGTVIANATCSDWTSNATTVVAQVGHSNRDGGGRPPSWNSTHASGGCAEVATNRAMSVGSGGGRGSFYCFAVP